MTNKQLRQHIRKIRFNRVMALLLAMIAIVCFVAGHWLTERYYDTWLHAEGDLQTQVSSIIRAVALHPTRIEGYNMVLDIHLQDGVLTEDENDQLQNLISSYQSRLKTVPEATALYRRIAFSYAGCYDADAEERLKKTYSYLRMQSYDDASALEATVIGSYIALGDYFSEYVWITGSLKKPTAVEIANLEHQLSATLNALQYGSDRDRLAFACSVRLLLSTHRQIWEETLGNDTVEKLEQKIQQQLLADVEDPAAIRLKAELAAQTSLLQKED